MNTFVLQKQPPTGIIRGLSVKLIAGIFFALLGILLTLDNLDLVDADRFLPFWPVVLIAAGVVMLKDRRSKVPGAVAIAAGALLLISISGWLSFSIFDLWPVVLILAGMAIVAHALGFRTPSLSGQTASTIWAVLGVRKETVTARNYAGGRIIAFMGGCELDLRNADIEQGSAELEVIVVWGGIEIKVPDGWEVIGNTVPIMGGADIRTKAAPGGRRLIVNGLAVMAGIDIKSVATEAV